MELDKEQSDASAAVEACQEMIGHGPEGWVPTQDYEEAMALSKQIKAAALAEVESEEERADMMQH